MFSVAGGGETGDADIDADLAAGGRQRSGLHVIAGQHQYPAPALAFDLDRLDPTPYLSVHRDLHLADALQIHPPCLGQPAGTVTVFGPLDAVESRASLEPRVARRLAGLDPAEEPLKRLVEPAQRGLLAGERPHRLIRAYGPDLGQLCGLIPVVDTSLIVRPTIPTFLQRRVVQLAMRLHAHRQGDVLARGGTQPKYVGTSDQATASLCSLVTRSGRSPQRAATRPPRIRRRYFGHHIRCSPKEHTPPGVRRNRPSHTLRTLRNDTDKPVTTRRPPAPTSPTAQTAGPSGP